MAGFFKKRHFSLRTHVGILLCGMGTLLGALFFQAINVATRQSHELNLVAENAIPAVKILGQIQVDREALQEATLKHRTTRDPLYLAEAEKRRESIARSRLQLADTLRPVDPKLVVEPGFSKLSAPQIQASALARVNTAQSAAQSLLSILAGTAILASCLAVWILSLMYRGLLQPLASMRRGLRRISLGEYRHRMPATAGVLEMQRLRIAFNEMAERLDRLDSAQAEFLSTVNHELKNPLTALKEGISILGSPAAVQPNIQARAQRAVELAVLRLERLVEDLLGRAKSESTATLRLALGDLSSTLETVIEQLRPVAEKRKMQIDYKQAGELAPIEHDADSMSQVFENVIINAIKYGAAGSVIEVSAAAGGPTGTARAGESLELRVSNDGDAPRSEEAPKLFDRYFRASNTISSSGSTAGTTSGSGAAKPAGQGIGLHVAKRIIDAHRGKIWAEVSSNRTTIVIQLFNKTRVRSVAYLVALGLLTPFLTQGCAGWRAKPHSSDRTHLATEAPPEPSSSNVQTEPRAAIEAALQSTKPSSQRVTLSTSSLRAYLNYCGQIEEQLKVIKEIDQKKWEHTN